MKFVWITSAVMLLTAGLAVAGQGEVCYSNAVPVNQSQPLTNEALDMVWQLTLKKVINEVARDWTISPKGMGWVIPCPLACATAA